MIDRTQPPKAGKAHSFRFPEYQRHRLANGLEILAARLPNSPLLAVELVSLSGAWYDPLGQEGLTTLHSGLLDEGTEKHSALELAIAVEQLGGHLACGAGWNATVAEVGGLAEHLDPLLDILGEVVLSPTFPEEEIERARSRRLAELLRRSSQSSIVASESFVAEIYGTTAYGRPMLGTAESVGSLKRDDFRSFYRNRFLAGGKTCLAVGDIDPSRIVQAIAERFSSWPTSAPPEEPTVEVEAPPGIRVALVDRPDAQQTELRIGHASVPRSHPDRPALVVMNAILGGKFTSRINLNLRETHGYTYGASSRFAARLGPGPFTVSTAVANGVAADAAREVLGEIRRIREERVTQDELRDTIDYLLGVFPYTLQTTGGLVRRLEEIAIHDLPDGYHDSYLAAIREVDREALLRVAREHLDADRLLVLAAGPADELSDGFAAFGEPKIIRSSPRDLPSG